MERNQVKVRASGNVTRQAHSLAIVVTYHCITNYPQTYWFKKQTCVSYTVSKGQKAGTGSAQLLWLMLQLICWPEDHRWKPWRGWGGTSKRANSCWLEASVPGWLLAGCLSALSRGSVHRTATWVSSRQGRRLPQSKRDSRMVDKVGSPRESSRWKLGSFMT